MNSLTIKQFIKLTFQTFCLLIVLALLNPVLAADARGQKLDNFKVDLSVDDATVIEVLRQIEEQTEFKFVYDRKVKRLQKTYDIAYNGVSLRSILELMAKDANLTFRRINHTISIDVKPEAPKRVVEVEFVTVTGTVTDEYGVPLAGASVAEKGTANGTITDFDGNFSIDVEEDAVLEVSYLGFKPQEVAINGRTTINIQLEEDATMLEDVVVVGYGTQRKSDVTGSIASIKSENFNQGVVNNPGQLLQGKVAGVNVTSVSGEPGASQNVIIRGVGSLRSGTAPLYVIDGFVISNNATGVDTNPLNFINPQDIESIDVLKDASATAIYGARAANGVIMITTKKGRAGRSEMNISMSTAMSSMANKIDVFSADEFRQQVVAAGGTLDDNGGNTDWQDELTRTGISKNIDLSMSGGVPEKSSYFASASVSDQEGIFYNSDLKRYSGRLNLNQKALQGKLNLDFNMTASRVLNERPDIGSTVVDMLQLNPTTPVYDTNGEAIAIEDASGIRINPLFRNEIYSDKAYTNRILTNIAPSLEIVKGLTYKINLGVDYSLTSRDKQTEPYTLGDGQRMGTLNSIVTSNSNFLVENTLTYNFNIGDHSVTFLAGHSYQETKFEKKDIYFQGGFSENGVEPKYQDQVSTEVTETTLDAEAYTDELQSFFGRLNYSFADKYLLVATMRADGSSRFGANNKYGYFPSVGLGWNIYREDFMDDAGFSNLKLRASWGQTGNQDGIGSKASLASYEDSRSDNDTYPLDGNENTLDDYPYGTVAVRTANPDLKWEVVTQSNVGLDFGVFGGSLTGTLEYFNKVTSDVVLFATTPDPINPTEKYWTNFPDMEIKNKGFELTLDYNGRLSEDFTFNVGGNFSKINNEVEGSIYSVITSGAAQGAGQTGATINGYINGEAIGAFYMKDFIGIGENGLNEFRDVVEDGESLDNDRIVPGSALPDVLYAFYLNLNYKNFDLGLNFNGASGNKIYNHTAMSLFTKGQLANNLNTTPFAVEYADESTTNSNEVSTRYLEDGSFLRLNNATIGYNLDPAVIGMGDWVNSIRFNITGQNLFVITDYSGFDPEVNTGNQIDQIQTFGIDRFRYPSARTFLFGLNVSF